MHTVSRLSFNAGCPGESLVREARVGAKREREAPSTPLSSAQTDLRPSQSPFRRTLRACPDPGLSQRHLRRTSSDRPIGSSSPMTPTLQHPLQYQPSPTQEFSCPASMVPVASPVVLTSTAATVSPLLFHPGQVSQQGTTYRCGRRSTMITQEPSVSQASISSVAVTSPSSDQDRVWSDSSSLALTLRFTTVDMVQDDSGLILDPQVFHSMGSVSSLDQQRVRKRST